VLALLSRRVKRHRPDVDLEGTDPDPMGHVMTEPSTPVAVEPAPAPDPGPALTRERQAGPVLARVVAAGLVAEWVLAAGAGAFRLGTALVSVPGVVPAAGAAERAAALGAAGMLLATVLLLAAGTLLRRAGALAALPTASRVLIGLAGAGNLVLAIAALTGLEGGGIGGGIAGFTLAYGCLLLVRVRPDATVEAPGRVRRRTLALAAAGLLVVNAGLGAGGRLLADELADGMKDPLDVNVAPPNYAHCGSRVDDVCARSTASITGLTVAWLGEGDGLEPRYMVAGTPTGGTPVVFVLLRTEAIRLTLHSGPLLPLKPGPPDATANLPDATTVEIRYRDAAVRLDWWRDGTAYHLDASPLGFLEDPDTGELIELAGRVRYTRPFAP
jgi:hypothetical protein